MSEFEKLLAGLEYNPSNEEIFKQVMKIRKLQKQYNDCESDDFKKLNEIKTKIFGSLGNNVIIVQPVFVTYGCNINIGNNVFINSNCTLLDGNKINIGNDVLFGPDVKLYAGYHSLDGDSRWKTDENGVKYIASFSKPITIGDKVWIGGNVTILPGVEIGVGSVIGAGSVVTKSIPEGVVAVGNPCKVIKKIER